MPPVRALAPRRHHRLALCRVLDFIGGWRGFKRAAILLYPDLT